MAILKSCCCWKTLRSGSVACGIYTLLLYSIIMVAGSFHVHTVIGHPVLLTFALLMVLLSAACAVSSVVLLLGLWADNRTLLLPWLVSISLTTLLDIVVLFYLTAESDFNPFVAVLFVTDVFIAVLNVYCLLCVSSQYQEYRLSRGRTFPDNLKKRSACRKRADAEGNFSPTKPSVFIADDMVSSSITKLSTSTTRRSSALSSCRLTPIKEESQARANGPADTLHQSLGATGSGETLSHVYLVSPRPSPVEGDEEEDEEEPEEPAPVDQRGAERPPLPVAEVVSESVYKWTI